MTELRGPRGVRTDLADFYRLWLPQHAAGCREAWGLKDDELPVPKSQPDDPRVDAYFAGDAPALDRWPMLYVNTGRRRQTAVDHTDDGDVEYRSIYPVRVFTWVSAVGRAEAQAQRDDLATVVQITTLAHTTLGGNGRFGAYAVVPSTLVTDFSRLEPVKGDRVVGGSYVGFDLQVTETLTDRLAMPKQQPRDTVSAVTATAAVLPYSEDVTP